MSPKALSMRAKTSSMITNEREGVVHERQGGGYEGQERVDEHEGLSMTAKAVFMRATA